jgi:hypothetical protein
MPRPNPLTLAVRDLCDDIAWHAVNLANGVFDLACVVAFGALVFASGLETPANPDARPLADQQAHTTKGCTPAPDCITVAPLDA